MSDTEITSIRRVTPRQALELCEDTIWSGGVPFLKSNPGLGKSSIFRLIAERAALKMIDHRISTSEPTDFTGIPEFYDTPNGRRVRFVPFGDLFPLEGDEVPQGFEGWMLFLDEFNQGDKQTMSASYKLLLDKMIGQYLLNARVAIALAGNLSTDRAHANEIGTALQSRVVHFEMIYDFAEWRDDVIIPNDWDIRILTFLERHPSKGHDFRPDHNDQTFACPRTWEMLNKQIKGKKFNMIDKLLSTGNSIKVFEMDRKVPMYGGTIGFGPATEFVQFCRVWQDLPSLKSIINDPLGSMVPQDPTIAWATIGMCAEGANPDNFSHLANFCDRFAINVRVLFYRMAIAKHPDLRTHPDYRSKIVEIGRYLGEISNG